MTFEESVRLKVDGSLAGAEWFSQRVPAKHAGYIQLGPEKRLFAVAMYHELHCVNTFRKALADPKDADGTPHHVQHCLNYLRQLFLCSADATLEPYDWTLRNYTQEPVGITRQCRDWTVVYERMEESYDSWVRFQRNRQHGDSSAGQERKP
ncbi:hypothetical protein PUNSTDRAFT_138857 [Punctularia strigosozonata HHB-11173 SS5]|uniref:Uncharacterized protein n=1 Tax=Punctularia strigosozonata (strain HHB-11173) TaxID=741275 RepID=R7S1M1_PUNST|nr:uncharacterized protein PUNSTDRAFT_138857 [Punctularia strigosozonata HHB-11173 SS5]EIN04128.1 hypothetical protein PUNSTDRAFT_138857 [Punctularia strigosozonata HHB-11173 SS5]